MSKYHAVKVKEDNITFDSKLEHQRYQELKLMQRAGYARDLRVHVRFPLRVKECLIGYYESDFTYLTRGGQLVVEDTKGVKTALYNWKKKHFQAEYGIEITEITNEFKIPRGHLPFTDRRALRETA